MLRTLEPGDRVRRGPDWRWGDQDITPGNLGTVMSPNAFHHSPQPWGITVHWDNGSTFDYPYFEGNQGIELVDPVRLLPGDRVVRGPDWHWDEQDGGEGGLGTVLESSNLPHLTTSRLITSRLNVDVEWDNETDPDNYSYRYATDHRDLRYVGHDTVLVDDGDSEGTNSTSCPSSPEPEPDPNRRELDGRIYRLVPTLEVEPGDFLRFIADDQTAFYGLRAEEWRNTGLCTVGRLEEGRIKFNAPGMSSDYRFQTRRCLADPRERRLDEAVFEVWRATGPAVPPFSIGDRFRVQAPLPGQTSVTVPGMLKVTRVFEDGTALGVSPGGGGGSAKAVLEPWMTRPVLFKL